MSNDDGATEALRDLLPLAAVGALDASERAALMAAIAGRADLQAELAELEAAAAVMADAAAEPPPTGLREDVMAAVEQLAQLAPLGDATGAPPGAPAAATPGVLHLDRSRRSRRRWLPAAAAAAVIALLAGTVIAVVGGNDEAQLDVAAVAADDQAVVIPLRGALSTLRLIHSPDHEAIALIGDGVPAPDGNLVYELWMIQDDEPAPLETFRPSREGIVEILMPDTRWPEGARFAITVEPPGGSQRPTGDVVAESA